jgi:ATP-dependent DNA helicase RecG
VAAEPIARLSGLLASAASSSFDAVSDEALGGQLREAVDRVLDTHTSEPLTRLRAKLDGFDRLGRQDRSVLVAEAMRVAMMMRAETSPAKAPSRRRPVAAAAAVVPVDAGALTDLPGVGPATAAKLRDKGLETIEDLAWLIPTRYLDQRQRVAITEVEEGEYAVVEGKVARFRQGFGRGRYMATLELTLPTGDSVVARWFHRMGGLDRVVTGADVILVGAVREYGGRPSMVHPDIYSPEHPPPPIAVQYPNVEGVGPRTVAKLCREAVRRVCAGEGPADVIPAEVAAAHGLPGLREALGQLHDPAEDLPPADVEDLARASSPAHRRLAFEEFFVLQTLLLRRRRQYVGGPCPSTLPDGTLDREQLRACLPFEPTSAQWRVCEEIAADMAAGPPMLRLLQGDVGSGKTAVAFAAALAVCRAGGQVAVMAPTEILAEQHLRTLGPWCEAAGLKVAGLTGSMRKGERASRLALVGAGQVDILVGTHALIVGDVHFERLGLVIVDEQHRFGVEQRAALAAKGQRPHLLVMTATPIPRTMALTAYGELEVSVIDELPPGRIPPVTRLYCGRGALAHARGILAKGVAKGARAYVVCPLVEQSALLDVSDVEESAAALRVAMPDRRIGVVHGRLPPADKHAVMNDFREGRLDILVATTVIEVGVDVPDARVILVEHAERFGLAQLHQLRGRVGRGLEPSACLLHTALGPASDAGRRLEVLAQTHDGFAVAEHDLRLRGPGEVFGTRQAGVPRLRFAGFAGDGARLLQAARDAAAAILAEDGELAHHPQLRAAVQRREQVAPVFAADSG